MSREDQRRQAGIGDSRHRALSKLTRKGHGNQPKTAIGRIEQMKERMLKKQCPFCGKSTKGRRRVVIMPISGWFKKKLGILDIRQKKVYRTNTMIRCAWCGIKHILKFGPKSKPLGMKEAFYKGTDEEPGTISAD